MNLKDYIKTKRGNATFLADQLGVSLSYLSQLASGESPISPERCVLIEQVTERKVGRRILRPDDWHLIWPELRTSSKQATRGKCSA